jgi:carbon-monoxide dehydrogenase catalytic subunit
MIVDVQCIMSSLQEISSSYHTNIVTTSSKAKIEGAKHFDFSEDKALEISRDIIRDAIMNFPNRGKTDIPEGKMDLVAGFSHEAINYMLGGKFRGSYTPLNDNIINGRIKGVAGVVGCCNTKVIHDQGHVNLVEELIANDILVVQTGCSAIACAKAGFLLPEAASKYAGKGLAEVCEATGMPPVLHSGSCVDNSRILTALSEMVRTGGLGKDISDLPVAGAAPEWMSEKAISIGQYFVASGVYTVFGVGLPVLGSKVFSEYIFNEYENIFGGKWALETDAGKMAGLIIDHINRKREKLGISKEKERVLFDMEMRREIDKNA